MKIDVLIDACNEEDVAPCAEYSALEYDDVESASSVVIDYEGHKTMKNDKNPIMDIILGKTHKLNVIHGRHYNQKIINAEF